MVNIDKGTDDAASSIGYPIITYTDVIGVIATRNGTFPKNVRLSVSSYVGFCNKSTASLYT
jgi:hypothetical protein